ncbi:RNA polymerase subunit sigma-70 [Rhizobium sp. CECT 9324]|uniref:RNA polymerase subunit sigma-70 n=1 Tax=Rhizobium sp. CECT 9324 TaxID=2845820 RepID=UPI001E390026|nr:RNA polymerase subunit sigma-70 [Rhizobium sp. CECT 9324]CAH0343021.1 ECF RNA polymerase sigma factor SigG [Rhizobium sp. CECT 9324]
MPTRIRLKMHDFPPVQCEQDLLGKACSGDERAFGCLIYLHRRQIFGHCYRMLGSPHDADDALQETLLAAWRGLATYDGRGSFAAWLYRIGTNVCLRLISKRPKRLLSSDHGPAIQSTSDLGTLVPGRVWVEPCPDQDLSDEGDPFHHLARRETVSLAFVAALQHLPGTQRAVLLLRDVLEFSAAETAGLLDLSVPAVTSALQRARATLRQRRPPDPSREEPLLTSADRQGELLNAFVSAWERRDVGALVSLLAEDVRFTMPPLPAWFDGRAQVALFFRERVFATDWRLQPLRANGQAGFACYLRPDGAHRYQMAAILLTEFHGDRIVHLQSFLDPSLHRRFGLPEENL